LLEKNPLEELVEEDMQGLLILFSEFETALVELIAKKVEGTDDIPGELLKSLESTRKQDLFAICNQIYETGVWINEFMESVIIPVEKKSGAQECANFRTINLVSHASKMVLKILTRRLESIAEMFPEKDQYGFSKGRAARDAIGAF